MTRADIVQRIAAMTHDITKAQVYAILFQAEDMTAAALGRGEEVALSGFGVFSSEVVGPRPGRNPRTGEAIVIGETRRFKFRPYGRLKSHVDATAQNRKAA